MDAGRVPDLCLAGPKVAGGRRSAGGDDGPCASASSVFFRGNVSTISNMREDRDTMCRSSPHHFIAGSSHRSHQL